MKNKLPRPTKGQLPDPTYSRMKFASCTDRADSGDGVGGKKSPRLADRGHFDLRIRFLISHIALPPNTAMRERNQCMATATRKSKEIIALIIHTSYICKYDSSTNSIDPVVDHRPRVARLV